MKTGRSARLHDPLLVPYSKCLLVDGPAPSPVGSTEWYDRLDQISSFGCEDQIGRLFTARREQREQQWYWYAYRKRGKKLRKVYLGKIDQLVPARLRAAARERADLPPEV